MDNKNHFFQNVDKFLQNEEFIKWRLFKSNESEEYWAKYIKENPHTERILKEAITQFEDVKINPYKLSDIEKREIYRKINNKIRNHKKRKWITYSGYVAAVALIGLFSIFFIREIKQSTDSEITHFDRIVGQALPEKDIYIITNGEKIKLADKSHIGLKENGTALVTDSASRTKELVLAKADLNTLVVPYGKRTNLTLADGTEVWLNSGTQLDFPTEFRGKTREIFVNGEIFIDVSHDASIPFIVHADQMQVRVQGTSFNISAFKDEITKTVVLVNGKVEVTTDNDFKAEMIPNEKIEIKNNLVSKEMVDVSEYVSWKEGMLVLNSTTMSDILKKIGRYYNVEFEKTLDVTLNDKNFSGKLFLSNNLDSVMTSLSLLSSTKYHRENNKIFIEKK